MRTKKRCTGSTAEYIKSNKGQGSAMGKQKGISIREPSRQKSSQRKALWKGLGNPVPIRLESRGGGTT